MSLMAFPVQTAGTRDRPECDSAGDPALLSGRSSCRSRSKKLFMILLLTGAQELWFEQKHLLEQEHALHYWLL